MVVSKCRQQGIEQSVAYFGSCTLRVTMCYPKVTSQNGCVAEAPHHHSNRWQKHGGMETISKHVACTKRWVQKTIAIWRARNDRSGDNWQHGLTNKHFACTKRWVQQKQFGMHETTVQEGTGGIESISKHFACTKRWVQKKVTIWRARNDRSGSGLAA